MNLLAIDTSGAVCSAAVYSGGVLTGEICSNGGLKHSLTLMPMVESALELANIAVSDMNLLAVVTGPGSFTGVRIGVSCARALSLSLEIPVIGVSALETLCAQPFPGITCALLDARRNQVYCAAYKGGERLLSDSAGDIGDFLGELRRFPENILFSGDGARAHEGIIRESFGERAYFSREPLRASAAGFLALARTESAVAGALIEPYYLRAPQAEREREERARG